MIKTKFLIWSLPTLCLSVCMIWIIFIIPVGAPTVSDDSLDSTFEDPAETSSSVSEYLESTSSEDEESFEMSEVEENSKVEENSEVPITSKPPEESDDTSKEEMENTSQEEIEDTSDTIELSVVLYNQHHEGCNLIDGAEYLNDIATLLQKHAPEELRISAGCAMAYTEGGSGKKGLYTLTNNCFGIRAYSNWTGYVYARSTGKVYKDYQTAKAYGAEDLFRAYNSMEESVIDYIKLMTDSYYDEVLNVSSDAEYFNYVLQKGYGESELYSIWLYVVNLYDLTQYNRN